MALTPASQSSTMKHSAAGHYPDLKRSIQTGLDESSYIFMLYHPCVLPSCKLTWQWKIPILCRKYIFKWSMFHCYVSLPECSQYSQNAVPKINMTKLPIGPPAATNDEGIIPKDTAADVRHHNHFSFQDLGTTSLTPWGRLQQLLD